MDIDTFRPAWSHALKDFNVLLTYRVRVINRKNRAKIIDAIII